MEALVFVLWFIMAGVAHSEAVASDCPQDTICEVQE